MKKVNIFLILFVISLIVLIILFAIMFSLSSSTYPNWMDDMWGHMGGMMGGGSVVSDPLLGYFGILIVVIGIVLVSIAGLVYFLIVPEIKPGFQNLQDENLTTVTSAYESVLKTLNADEVKVLNVLKNHDGKYLQKYIRHEAKLSRLKTHRVLSRFADRGIVTLKKTGNTNEVTLAEWLR
ncbi:hypothetical protein AC477_04910 [miscellaneous Crenarchaeota group-1 archaeon SG8-32-1]|uniref:DUF7343 domain-containing protein n=1 Tax=miscellaneous Crenarchaeota group-1 archaeon SG8-32-1 TaxID=1685124 RepID=A0A0M0BPY7_9ARCH|nr:MAG: hypothetical protein AC477_04910 [miscellaneous Crenarchaeota group-1 archaeon SG8-32-1]